MNMFPYKWTFSGFFKNLNLFFWDVRCGIGNMVKWFPIIWKDRDFDQAYLLRILEFKFKNMSRLFAEHGVCERSEEQASICIQLSALCRRLHEEPYWEEAKDYSKEGYTFMGETFPRVDFDKFEKLQKADLKKFSKTLEKELLGLWD